MLGIRQKNALRNFANALSVQGIKLIIFRICYFAIVFVLAGCAYTFTTAISLETKILRITPLGINAEDARNIVEKEFGKERFDSHGLAIKRVNGWASASAYSSIVTASTKEAYYFSFKLGTHPSSYIVLPTYVYADWYFNKNNQLVRVTVRKIIDAL